MKDGKENLFVRFGDIDRYKKQKAWVGNSKEESFHVAPAPRGFYAMPYLFQESFLVTSLDLSQPEKFSKRPPWPADLDEFDCLAPHTDAEHDEYTARVEAWHAECDAWREKYDAAKNRLRKTFRLKNEDLIWTHLIENVKRNEIERSSGTWVLCTVSAYKKACRKEFAAMSGTGFWTHHCADLDAFEVFVSGSRY